MREHHWMREYLAEQRSDDLNDLRQLHDDPKAKWRGIVCLEYSQVYALYQTEELSQRYGPHTPHIALNAG